ncbi:MAG: AAA family ATPase [Euryarchaeota archaeon]|jgi:DNA sulfur modification protein DndD|nr:AAA family ATPase [Euryarchaeota archaeon]
MQLEDIKLTNWQSYKDVYIDFSGPTSTRNSAILYARNGKGKSAFFEAIKFLLYGADNLKARDFDLQKPLVHENLSMEPLMNHKAYMAGEKKFSVEAHFSHLKEVYNIKRSYSATKSKAKEHEFSDNFVILDSKKTKLTNPEDFIEKMLPEQIVKFFFIDGEAMIEYRKLFSPLRAGLADATEELLRMHVMDAAIAGMGQIKNRTRARIRKEDAKLEKDKTRKKDLKELSDKIVECEAEIERLELKEAKYDKLVKDGIQWFKDKGDAKTIQGKIDAWEGEIEDDTDLIVTKEKELSKQISQSWKTIMLPNIKAQIESELTTIKRQRRQRKEINRLENLIDDLGNLVGGKSCNTCDHLHPDTPKQRIDFSGKIEIIKKQKDKLERTVNSPEEGPLWQKIMEMRDLQTDLEFTRVSDISKEISKLRLGIELKKEKIITEGEGISSKYLKEAAKKEEENIENASLLELTRESIAIQQLAQEGAEKRYEVRKSTGKKSGKSSGKVKKYETAIENLEVLIKLCNDSKIPFRDQTRNNLSQKAGDAYLKIIDENHDKFEVDADFCFRVSEKGILQALTPGQKGLATYCLLEALSEISEINFPLIVDSPGQGIDLEYINAIFEHVLSLSRRQVIILPNTAEISSNPKKSFGPATSLIAHIEKPRGSGKSKVTDIHRRKKK